LSVHEAVPIRIRPIFRPCVMSSIPIPARILLRASRAVNHQLLNRCRPQPVS